jgi:hypothetical protein
MIDPKNNLDYYVNGWLKYFGTTIEEVFEKNPHYKDDNRQFYLDYAVTQEQYDEWYKWAFKEIKKDTKYPNEMIKRSFEWLNMAPSIKNEIKQ